MIYGILTHPRPHFDELLAIWLLFQFGEEKYPGVRQAIADKNIDICRDEELSNHSHHYDLNDYIPLGIGGGKFDEHPSQVEGRKQNECCASLVDKDLGVSNLPELSEILKFATAGDLNGNSNPFDVAALVKLINAVHPEDPLVALEVVFTALDAKYVEQKDFHITAKKEAEKAVLEEVATASGKILRMVKIETDCEAIPKYLKSQLGGNADVVIKRNSRGQVQIFNNKFNLDLTDTAQILRLVEQENHDKVVTWDFETLGSEGKVPGCDEWHYFPKGRMLFNGSLTAPNTPATSIPLVDIQALVKIGISGKFEPSREVKCKAGICTSTRNNECKWYRFGLARCRTVRWNQANPTAAVPST